MGFLDKVVKVATEAGGKVAETSKSVAKSTQVKIAISSLKSKREKVFKEIGERAYILSKDGRIEDATIDALVREIDEINAEIEQKEQELKES